MHSKKTAKTKIIRMRNTSFICFLLLFSGSSALISCRNTKGVSPAKEPEFKLQASAQRYLSALGKGRGVLFHINFISPDSMDSLAFRLDSLMVNGKNVPANWNMVGNKPHIEGNYFIAEQEPEAGKIPEPTVNSPDVILYFSEYLPATLHFHYQDKACITSIEQFESISE